MKIKAIGLALTLGLIATVTHAGQIPGSTLIGGSKHDFKTTGYVGNGGTYTAYNKCSTCHAAHKPKANEALWGRALSATGGAFTVWDMTATGQVLDATNGPDGELLTATDFATSGSAMCLSCHDGVTAIGGTVTMATTFRGNWGRNLSDMHPIARKVPFGTPGWQDDLAAANTASGSNVVVDVVGANSYVGCTSCHSMHTGGGKILRLGERCLSCHNR